MRKTSKAVVAVAVLALLGQAVPAQADPKGVVGWSAIAGGAVLMVSAFNHDTSCPAGYTTHTVTYGFPSQTDTTCVHVDRYGSDVRPAPTTISFERPTLMWTGLAAVGAGTVILLLPKKVQRVTNGTSVAVTPTGWHASKAINFGK